MSNSWDAGRLNSDLTGAQPSTLAVREGHQRTAEAEHSEPLFLSSSYVFNSAAQAAASFAGTESGNVYSRYTNPTVAIFEKRLAALEQAEQAVATSSGMAAIWAVVMAFCQAGDHILVSRSVFGATVSLFEKYAKKFGIEVEFIGLADHQQWREACKANTRLLFIESPSNPLAEVADIRALSQIAHEAEALLVVDNCFCTPVLQQPLTLGADIVVHSATKFIDGQGRCLGGAVLGAAALMKEVGTRMIVGPLLEANDIELTNLPEQWTTQSGTRAAEALVKGELDAAFFIGPAEQPLIQQLAANPELDLMNFGRSAAYQARLPFIRAIPIGEGLLNLGNDTPSKDLTTLAPSAVLAVNEDFHPALTPLFLEATKQITKQTSLIDSANDFPQAAPESFPLLDEAAYYHKNGLPLLQRYVPFIIASLADRYIILVIPLLVVLFPLFKVAGPIYRWRIRARIYRWYKYLREVDKRFLNHTLPERVDEEIEKLESLQEELSKVEVPLSYSNELYELHLHVRYVIRRLQAYKAEINGDLEQSQRINQDMDQLAADAVQHNHP